ncbi:cycle checkpoint protein RAD17 [Seminavis robusta]|uniref:Cycle checkpoint protein RAD17 n=1 Tax=Seminavis robusta TaxID=568900 RepID=A0A9N8H2W6_9STRA|nr:cycle checkpoint protein RAD17 [Seminavis robusta]|eukprot:Sro26_g017450.1 cycle checkpoint protein RAD17 (734) ;mRNA; f:12400-14691
MSSQDVSSSQRSTGSKRRRRSAPPPGRLGWPGGLTQSSGSLSQPNNNSNNTTHKRKRSSSQSSIPKQHHDNSNDDSSLWTEKYTPTCRKELCVAPKKIQEVSDWLDDNDNKNPFRLLILVGRPGIGKSTLIRVLAQEANVELLEWSETYSSWSNHVESLSPLQSFGKFLQQSGAGFSSLDLQFTSTTSANSRTTANDTSLPRKKLIVLEELPNLANAESQERFRELFTQHIQTSHIKTVWIYSDVTEGNHKPQDLERHVDPSILYSQSQILQINPATKAQLKKSLERIAKAEQFTLSKDTCEKMHLQSGGDVRYAIMALQFDRVGQSNKSSSSGRGKKKKSSFFEKPPKAKQSTTTTTMPPRDTQWTAFHALGKILYAKRQEPSNNDSISTNPRQRPPLQFDPEGVLEHCDLDLGNALTYLGFHSVDFFTDIEEISTAMDLYSDASYLLEQTTNYNYQRRNLNNNNTVSCPIFPEGYVTSLASRSVGYANHHPAPSRFRQLDAPKIFEIRRKRTDNEYQLHRLQRRLSSMADGADGVSHFVLDRLPFLRMIEPQAVTSSLDRLHSSNSEHTGRFEALQQEEEAAAMARLQKEQEEILQADDIEEFDSSDEEEKTVAVAAGQSQQDRKVPGSLQNTSARPATTQSTQPAKKPSKPVFNPYKKKQQNTQSQQKPPPQVTWSRPPKPVTKLVNPYARKSKASGATVPNNRPSALPPVVAAEQKPPARETAKVTVDV